MIEAEMCKRLGISVDSFINYKKDRPELFDALKEGKQIADYRVENALYNRAIGYEYEEVVKELQATKQADGTEKMELVVTKVLKKRMAPDTTAQIFWLKNRKPGDWKDRREVAVGGYDGSKPIEVCFTEPEAAQEKPGTTDPKKLYGVLTGEGAGPDDPGDMDAARAYDYPVE